MQLFRVFKHSRYGICHCPAAERYLFFHVGTCFLYILKVSYCESLKWQLLWGPYLSQCFTGQIESWNRATGFAYLSLFSTFSRAAGSWSIRFCSPLLSEDGSNFERTCSFTVVSCDASASWNTPQSSFHRAFLKTGVTAETTDGREQREQVPPSKCVKQQQTYNYKSAKSLF